MHRVKCPRIFNLLLPIFFLLAVLQYSGCSSKDDPTPVPAPHVIKKPDPKPTPDPVSEISDSDQAICDLMQEAVALASLIHLRATPATLPQHVENGLSRWARYITNSFEIDISQHSFTSIQTDCASFHHIVSAMYDAQGSTRVELDQYKLFMANEPVDFILTDMDIMSGVSFDTVKKEPFEITGFELPVRFLERSDYRWRYPSALIVDPLYKGSLKDTLLPRSRIFSVDAVDVSKQPFDVSKSLIKHSISDQEAKLNVQISGESTIRSVLVESKSTDHESLPVRAGMLQNDILYIHIESISEKSKDQTLIHLMDQLIKNQNAKGLILDLRGNPGGATVYASKIASLFLPPDSIVIYNEGVNHKESTESKVWFQETILNDFDQYIESFHWQTFDKILILTDRTSASSSEVIASALTMNAMAISLGETTFGKSIGAVTGTFINGLLPLRITFDNSFMYASKKYAQAMGFEKSQWINWQSVGLTPMIEKTDPVMNHLFQNEDAQDSRAPFSMKNLEDWGYNIIPNQKDVQFPDKPVLSLPDEVQHSQRLMYLPQLRDFVSKAKIPSCDENAIPGNPAFDESAECILEMGIAVMKQWISLGENA